MDISIIDGSSQHENRLLVSPLFWTRGFGIYLEFGHCNLLFSVEEQLLAVIGMRTSVF
jgi:hypothetical protein